jgi:hypothetical protein
VNTSNYNNRHVVGLIRPIGLCERHVVTFRLAVFYSTFEMNILAIISDRKYKVVQI